MDQQKAETGIGHFFVGKDPFFRLQRAVGLAPPRDLGVKRRALFFALLCWLPIIIAALIAGRAFGGIADEPLLLHFAIHSRSLIAIPLFILGDSALLRLELLIRHFVVSGLVGESSLPRFQAALNIADRLLNSWSVFAILVALVAANVIYPLQQFERLHEASWAIDRDAGRVGLIFAGWWYLLVLRPIFSLLLGLWTWRIVVFGILLRRISKLDLELVPVHPDRAGGLGFLSIAPQIFIPFVLGVSIVLASHFAHSVLYHDMRVESLRMPMALYVMVVLFLCLSPLLVLTGKLKRLRRKALLDYGALAGRHGRLVDRRWVRGETIRDDALLNAPELGPVADVRSMHETVSAIQLAPIGRQTVLTLLAAAALPMVPVLAIEIPVGDLLKMLAGYLF
ncbi:hypothetical protein [Methylocaldum sp.]|uniref:hypothetical protein n=1 Tax=Methylocaldum sp. TaxID=1969727 RepID=UPI002D33820A|nr:hypothetical protein [Methylocaldum sp.]HYE36912.1 hypothetical protein [Methylocaldum sp.]